MKRAKLREVRARLRQLGCAQIPFGKGSHETWRTPGGRNVVLSGKYANDEVSVGVLGKVEKALKLEGKTLWDN